MQLHSNNAGVSWLTHSTLEEDPSKTEINFLLTIDAAKGPNSDDVDRKIDDNVEENLNIYQTKKSAIGSHGGKNTRDDGSETGIRNEISISYTDENGKKQTVVHGNIDEATLQRAINELVKKLNNN